MLNKQELLDAFKDEEFLKKILGNEDIEYIQKAFKQEKSIDISLEETKDLMNAIAEMIAKLQNGELSKEELEKIKNGDVSEKELEKISGGGKLAKVAVGITVAAASVALIAGAGAFGYVSEKKMTAGLVAGDSRTDAQKIGDAAKTGWRKFKDWFH